MERERRLEKIRRNCETPVKEERQTSAELRTAKEIRSVENIAEYDRLIT